MIAHAIVYLLAALAAVRGAILATTACAVNGATALLAGARGAIAPQRARFERVRRTIADHPVTPMAARVPNAAKRVGKIAALTYTVVATGMIPSWIEYAAVAYAGAVVIWHFYKACREKPIVDAAEPLWGQLRTAWSHP